MKCQKEQWMKVKLTDSTLLCCLVEMGHLWIMLCLDSRSQNSPRYSEFLWQPLLLRHLRWLASFHRNRLFTRCNFSLRVHPADYSAPSWVGAMVAHTACNGSAHGLQWCMRRPLLLLPSTCPALDVFRYEYQSFFQFIAIDQRQKKLRAIHSSNETEMLFNKPCEVFDLLRACKRSWRNEE